MELAVLKAARDTADARHDTLITVLRTESARLRAQVASLERELARSRPRASSQAPASQPPRGRVLWVDDNPQNNAAEMATLRDLGFAIETASSTDLAIVALDRFPADVVISDMSRGTDDRAGLLLVAQLRGKKIDTPVIFYVGTVTDARRQEAAKVGVRVTSSASELAGMVSSTPRR